MRLDIDLSETIVACEDFEGTLIEFIETNHFNSLQTLSIIAALLAHGKARIDQGNGDHALLRMVNFTLLERELPYLAA